MCVLPFGAGKKAQVLENGRHLEHLDEEEIQFNNIKLRANLVSARERESVRRLFKLRLP